MKQDFEFLPIGTGAELARLNDECRSLSNLADEYAEDIAKRIEKSLETNAELARLNDLVQELASALKVLHPREHVFRTPTDEQEKTIVAALAKAGL